MSLVDPKKEPRGKSFQPGNQWRFKPGESGNPGGRPKGLMTSFINYLEEVDPETDKPRRDSIAKSICDLAASGDVQAFQAISRMVVGETIHTPDAAPTVVIDR